MPTRRFGRGGGGGRGGGRGRAGACAPAEAAPAAAVAVPSAAEQQLALSSKQRWFLQSQERLAEDAGGGGGGDLTALKRLERRAGVAVSLDRGAGVAVVRARSAAAAKQGAALLQALLGEHACEASSEEICEEMPIPAAAAAAVVGKGGASIRAIEAASGARLQLVRVGGSSTTLRLRGDAGAAAAARALVGEVVADVTSPLLLELDPADVARVLGQGGANLKQIEAETGAKLRVEGGGGGGGPREGAAAPPPRVAVRAAAPSSARSPPRSCGRCGRGTSAFRSRPIRGRACRAALGSSSARAARRSRASRRRAAARAWTWRRRAVRCGCVARRSRCGGRSRRCLASSKVVLVSQGQAGGVPRASQRCRPSLRGWC